MKRSEMVQKMAELFEQYSNDKQYIIHSYQSASEMFLNIAVELGMKPPIKKKCPVLLTETHTWEPEDGQK